LGQKIHLAQHPSRADVLGFAEAFSPTYTLPQLNVDKLEKTPALKTMELIGVRTVDEAMDRLF
jgi:hypothetical protein